MIKYTSLAILLISSFFSCKNTDSKYDVAPIKQYSSNYERDSLLGYWRFMFSRDDESGDTLAKNEINWDFVVDPEGYIELNFPHNTHGKKRDFWFGDDTLYIDGYYNQLQKKKVSSFNSNKIIFKVNHWKSESSLYCYEKVEIDSLKLADLIMNGFCEESLIGNWTFSAVEDYKMDGCSKNAVNYPIFDTLKLEFGESYSTVGDTLFILTEKVRLTYKVQQYSYYKDRTSVLILNALNDSSNTPLSIIYYRD